MENPIINLEQPPQTTWYAADTPAGKLERLLQAEGTPYIGDINHRAKHYTRPDGEIRPGGLDMEPGERAYRTYCIKQLTKFGLDKVHAYEQTYMNRFLLREEMAFRAKEPINATQFTPEQREYAIDWCNSHRPIVDKRYKGLIVPPYIIYDAEFDGMDYQHSWDLCTWYAPWELPLGGSSSISGKYR